MPEADADADDSHGGGDCREAVERLYYYLDGELTVGAAGR